MPASPRFRLIFLVLTAAALCCGFVLAGGGARSEFVLTARIEKITVMILVAYCVAVSSVLFQTITHNHILTPSLLGFDALFVLVQAVGILMLGSAFTSGKSTLVFCCNAVLMAGGAALIFRWFASKHTHDLHVLMLSGVLLAILFKGLTALVMRMIDPNDYLLLQDLMFANFNSSRWDLVPITLLVIVAATVIIWRMRKDYDVIALGRDMAVNLGVNHRRVVAWTFLAIALLVAVATALVGPLAFLGLLASNMAYWMIGSHKHRHTLPAAIGCAVIILVGCQALLERALGLRLPVTVLIDFLGGLLFLILIMKRKSCDRNR